MENQASSKRTGQILATGLTAVVLLTGLMALIPPHTQPLEKPCTTCGVQHGDEVSSLLALAPIPDPISTPGSASMKGPDAPCGRNEIGEIITPCPKANPSDPSEPVRCPSTCPDDPKEVKTRFCNNAGSPCPETDENCPTCLRRDGSGNKTCKTCRTGPGEGPKNECTQPDKITEGPTLVPVGVNATYHATGPQGAPCFAWSGGDDPTTATGPSYTTKWTTPSTTVNDKEVNVTGDPGWGAKRNVTVVGVRKVVKASSDPEDAGPLYVVVGSAVSLAAKSDPVGVGFPANQPIWTISTKPDGSSLGNPASGETIEIVPDLLGDYLVTATCGLSSKDITVKAVGGIFDIFAKGGGAGNPYGSGTKVRNLLGVWPGDQLTLELRFTTPLPDPLPPSFIKWTTTTGVTPADNSTSYTFTRSTPGYEHVSVSIPDWNLTRYAHIGYPDVGEISETPGLALYDPLLYATVGFYGLAATEYASGLEQMGVNGFDANAIQHAYWNSLIASDPLYSTADAIFATTAHEFSNKLDGGLAFDSVSDLHNNSVGAAMVYEVGGQIQVGLIKEELLNKLKDGVLWRIDSSGVQVEKTNGTSIFPQ